MLRTDGRRGVKRPTADEDRELAKERARRLVEEVEAPVDRGAEGLMARHRVLTAAAQHAKPLVQLFRELFGREQLHPRRGQLDGQRNSVNPPADFGHEGRIAVGKRKAAVNRASTIDEELDGLGLLE